MKNIFLAALFLLCHTVEGDSKSYTVTTSTSIHYPSNRSDHTNGNDTTSPLVNASSTTVVISDSLTTPNISYTITFYSNQTLYSTAFTANSSNISASTTDSIHVISSSARSRGSSGRKSSESTTSLNSMVVKSSTNTKVAKTNLSSSHTPKIAAISFTSSASFNESKTRSLSLNFSQKYPSSVSSTTALPQGTTVQENSEIPNLSTGSQSKATPASSHVKKSDSSKVSPSGKTSKSTMSVSVSIKGTEKATTSTMLTTSMTATSTRSKKVSLNNLEDQSSTKLGESFTSATMMDMMTTSSQMAGNLGMTSHVMTSHDITSHPMTSYSKTSPMMTSCSSIHSTAGAPQCSCPKWSYPDNCGAMCCAGGSINATPANCMIGSVSVKYTHKLCNKTVTQMSCGDVGECACTGTELSSFSFLVAVTLALAVTLL